MLKVYPESPKLNDENMVNLQYNVLSLVAINTNFPISTNNSGYYKISQIN